MPSSHHSSSAGVLSLLLAAACGEASPTAAPSDPVYRFGAKFEPPVGRVVHGIGQWESYNVTYSARACRASKGFSR
ncbi:MAG: hypothetical protein Q8N53_24585 [Longimicrobiales bacterium]|nr:hypothetical protein [Longimicrobiales bacterium]